MNIKTLLITVFMLNASFGEELKNWKGTPFNEINTLVAKCGISRVYLYPEIKCIVSKGVVKKEISKNSFLGIIDSETNINLFSQLLVNNCKSESYPQLTGNPYQLDIIFNKKNPVVTLTAFEVDGEWYLCYMFKDASMKRPTEFPRKCDKEFSNFLTASFFRMHTE